MAFREYLNESNKLEINEAQSKLDLSGDTGFKKISVAQFKKLIDGKKVSFAGATKMDLDKIYATILKALVDPKFNWVYDRTANVRSGDIQFTREDGNSYLPLAKSTVYQYEDVFVVSEWNNTVYRVKDL